MRRPTIRTMDNNLPVQCVSERDFLFPDADEKYVPDVLAYIQAYDFQMFNALLGMLTPEAVVASFPYCRTLKKAGAAGRSSSDGASFSQTGGGANLCRLTSCNGSRGKSLTGMQGSEFLNGQ